MIATLLAGYFLVLGSEDVSTTRAMVVIPSEYSDKAACEQAANTVVSYGWQYLCVPSDTHIVNKEFD
jgi:hypothetical protein